jgi:GMP synthase (glutamine-hydrolysing)
LSDLSTYKAVILGGSPFSVRGEDAPHQIYLKLEEASYASRMLRTVFSTFSGEVAASNTREYGRANLSFIKPNETFFEGVDLNSQVWMSHSDSIKSLPQMGSNCSTNDVEFAAYKIEGSHLCDTISSKYFILLMDQKCWRISW